MLSVYTNSENARGTNLRRVAGKIQRQIPFLHSVPASHAVLGQPNRATVGSAMTAGFCCSDSGYRQLNGAWQQQLAPIQQRMQRIRHLGRLPRWDSLPTKELFQVPQRLSYFLEAIAPGPRITTTLPPRVAHRGMHRGGGCVMADFLIGLAFVAMVLLPALVASFHQARSHDGEA